MNEIALACGATVAQIALAWQLADLTISSPIIGANSITQLEDSLGAVEISLNSQEKALLDKLSS